MRTPHLELTDAKSNLRRQACRLHEEQFVAADTAASTEQNQSGKERI
jgi:hypothetical protein